MVGDSVGVDSDSFASAGLDHLPQLSSAAVSSIQLVGRWLVDEVPWIEFTILWPFIGEYRLLGWEYLHAHVSSFAEELAFLLNVGMWPSKELNDSSLLATLVV